MKSRSFVIRTAKTQDVERLVMVGAASNPCWPLDREAFDAKVTRLREKLLSPGSLTAFIAETEGQDIGRGLANRLAGFHQRGGPKARLVIDVFPDWRGRGVGSSLMRHLVSATADWDFKAWSCFMESRDQRSIQIGRHWGFEPQRDAILNASPEEKVPIRFFLDLSEDSFGKADASPIEITPLATADLETPAAKEFHKQHETARFSTLSYEDYSGLSLDEWKGHHRMGLAAGGLSVLALDGDKIVAASFAQTDVTTKVLSVEFTFVTPNYRNAGLARAIKLEMARLARMRGFSLISTEIRSDNVAMLAVATSLGYVPIAMQSFERPK